MRNYYKDALLGLATGDALGVPVEFVQRQTLQLNPVTGMRAFGTHGQPAGTWSDDSSLAFCLAETLCHGYDLQDLGNRFVQWKHYNYWTPRGTVFDIGITTAFAIDKIGYGVEPEKAGGSSEEENGNGSLMRILPLVFYLRGKQVDERFRIIRQVSSLTHRHIRSVIACFIYIEYALELLKGSSKETAYTNMRATVNQYLRETDTCTEQERNKFHRILLNPIGDYEIVDIKDEPEAAVHSSGYVLNTLEASFWCLLNTGSYAEAVLKAVNLGHDADTTGAVTGGLAGLVYGWESIPASWLDVLARRSDIDDLCTRLRARLQ